MITSIYHLSSSPLSGSDYLQLDWIPGHGPSWARLGWIMRMECARGGKQAAGAAEGLPCTRGDSDQWAPILLHVHCIAYAPVSAFTAGSRRYHEGPQA